MQHFSQIAPRVCTLVLFIEIASNCQITLIAGKLHVGANKVVGAHAGALSEVFSGKKVSSNCFYFAL